MSTHAGEPLGNIILRKKLECEAGKGEFAGTFWWGVGDSRGPAIWLHLAEHNPEVLFSEMPSKASPKDRKPSKCSVWTTYRVCNSDKRGGYGGELLAVPNNIIVYDSEKEESKPAREVYYALVCSDMRQCGPSEVNPLYVDNMKNLKGDGNPGKKPGPRQTTSVVKYSQCAKAVGRPYPVKMRAKLAPPYFVELRTPIPLDDSQLRSLKEIGKEGNTIQKYRSVARKIRG